KSRNTAQEVCICTGKVGFPGAPSKTAAKASATEIAVVLQPHEGKFAVHVLQVGIGLRGQGKGLQYQQQTGCDAYEAGCAHGTDHLFGRASYHRTVCGMGNYNSTVAALWPCRVRLAPYCSNALQSLRSRSKREAT